MRLLSAVALLGYCGVLLAQDVRGTNPRRQWSVFSEYANTSSRMMIGESRNRKLAAAGVSYAWLIGTHKSFAYRWQVDVRPVVVIGSPYSVLDSTYHIQGQPDTKLHAEGNTLKACAPGTYTGPVYYNGAQIGTFVTTNTCSRQWTYAGAASPFGQRLNFFPKNRLQPYVAANTGFLAATRDVPMQRTAMFNFTFEFGAGLEWFAKPGKSVALDWRYHHISNAGHGQQNAGIDSGTLKLTYSFGR